MMKSCSTAPWQLEICSGHGNCEKDGSIATNVEDTLLFRCVCLPGWGSLGDLSLIDGIDCNINYDAMKALWIIEGILGLLPLGLTVMYFRKKYKTAKENRKRMNIQDPVILFPLMFLIASISMILTAIFYVIDPKRHYLGGSFEVSLLTTIFKTSFFEGLTGFLTVVVRFFYSYAEMLPAEASSRTKRNMIFLKRASPFYAFVSLATGILPICMYRYPNQVQQISSAFYFLLFLFAGSGSLLLHATALNPIIREIEKHTKELKQYSQDGDGKLESVVYKMELARFSLLSSSPPVFIMYILLALIPYLQRNTCYVLPFLFMTGASISFFTTLTLMNYVKPTSYKGSSVKTANGSGVKAAAESSSHAPVADARIAAYTSSSG